MTFSDSKLRKYSHQVLEDAAELGVFCTTEGMTVGEGHIFVKDVGVDAAVGNGPIRHFRTNLV